MGRDNIIRKVVKQDGKDVARRDCLALYAVKQTRGKVRMTF